MRHKNDRPYDDLATSIGILVSVCVCMYKSIKSICISHTVIELDTKKIAVMTT